MGEDDADSGDPPTRPGRPTAPETSDNRLVERRDPVDRSDSGLVSRDYQPRHGGPELIASWPLGPPPRQSEPGDVDWVVTDEEFVQLQRNQTVTHLVGPIENNKIYLGVRGTGHIDTAGETFRLRLRTTHLEGDRFETELELSNTTPEPFVTPMVEFAPDGPEYREHSFIGREMYGGYVLSASVTGGSGYLDQGTSVHLWSE